MGKSLKFVLPGLLLLFFAGCVSPEKLPSEDIEVLEKYSDVIAILRDPKLPANSREKYQAAKKLIQHVDLYYTRETRTVDKLFYHRDAVVDSPISDNPVFTFYYQYGNKFVRIRFFTYMMFVTRVEIKENE